MNKLLVTFIFLFSITVLHAQFPVPMAGQQGLTFTENFADIANWTNGFSAGIGANHFSSVAVLNSGTIPAAVKTTVSTTSFANGPSTGVQKGNEDLILFCSGTTDNNTAIAIDLLLDFSNVQAGTLGFSWSSVNNSTGDRNGSLRVYASNNGGSFTELATASVLNITNNISTSGNITAIQLPASFNGSAGCVLRFYYHNGSGGTTGSRPKISIDNIQVTATGNVCNTPITQPGSLQFTNISSTSISAGFQAASPAPDRYLTIASINSNLTNGPEDGQVYLPGDGLGDGFVVENSNAITFSANSLAPSSTYYFFTYAVNDLCTGGPAYLTLNPLSGNASTTSGLPTCTAPAIQPSNLNVSSFSNNSVSAFFSTVMADGYLVLKSISPSLSVLPTNGQYYNPGDLVGNAAVVQVSNSNNFTANGLSANTAWYFFIFSVNFQNCSSPAYNLINPLTGSQVTLSLSPCSVPANQPNFLMLSSTNNAIIGSFNPSSTADAYLIIRSSFPAVGATPANNTEYPVGSSFGGGVVVSNDGSTNFISSNLISNTTYYFYIFAANKDCSGGTKYFPINPLKGNATTTNLATYNYYFGNLHAHSDYSDGNKDNPGYTPADDYNYALTSQCMDFLGISEHNHYSSAGNPGNKLANYHLGISQANSFTLSHPDFIAMYGMEWGVISGGGHVVVYGNGMDNLFGWETGSGAWGSTNNYDMYVPKNTYTGSNGLFKIINDYSTNNTFGSFAHPNSSDYNNLSNTAYDVVADNAISATAVESGPATSTNTTYTNPASSMAYLWYYQKLLAKGYHLGPVIDHDNHNTTFGKTTYSRTAIVAPALNKPALISAMKNRHFYATQDCDSKVDFSVNANIMGSIITERNPPVISVTLTDATTSTTGAVIRLMFGIPGSGVLPVKIDSVTGNNLNYIDNNLLNGNTGYYYVDITNNGSRIITAPVWYTRNDVVVLPVKFGSFTVDKLEKTARLSWYTETESNSSHFIAERSTDGRNWTTIGRITAAGNSSSTIPYQLYDNNPVDGINYYRLKLIDRDGSFTYSEVREIVFRFMYDVIISPNPANDYIRIATTGTSMGEFSATITDASGKKILSKKYGAGLVYIPVAHLAKGIYFIKVIGEAGTVVKKLMIQ